MSDATVPDVLKLNADNTYPIGYALNILGDQTKRVDFGDPISSLSIGVEHNLRDEFVAYIRGWSDGTGVHAMRPEFTSHATLATPYNEGYADGRKARKMAHVAASEKYGHRVSVLRTPESV